MNQKTRQDIKKRVTKKRNREVGINIRLLPEEKKHFTELATHLNCQHLHDVFYKG